MFKRLFWIVFAGGLLTLLGFRLYQELAPASGAADNATGGPGARQAALLVEAARPELRNFDRSLDALGELQPLATVEVMSRISGRLKAVMADRGDATHEGQLLVLVEDEDLQQQIRRSEAAIEVARAAAQREQATLDNLQIQLRRFQQLHEQELVSLQDLQDLQSRVAVAESQLTLAGAQIRQAEAALKELQIQQEQTRIYSPLDGLVATRHLEPGALVSPSVPILSVLKVERVKTVIPVPEGSLRSVAVGLTATVTVDAFPDRLNRGAVTRISPFLNPETRSADVEIEIPNPEGLLKPGMFARVRLDARLSEQKLAIPRAALIQRGEQKGVYLITEDSSVVFQPIQIGRIQAGFVEIQGGLEPASLIVSTGAQNLNDGDSIRLAGAPAE